jgi:hypothetical protein
MSTFQVAKDAAILILGIASGKKWMDILKMVGTLLKDIWDYAGYISDAAYQWQHNLIETVKNWAMRNIVDPIKRWALGVWEDIKRFFSNLWNEIKSWFTSDEQRQEPAQASQAAPAASATPEDESSFDFDLDVDTSGVTFTFKFGDYELSAVVGTDGLKLKGNLKGYKFEFGVGYEFEGVKFKYSGEFGESSGEIKFSLEQRKRKPADDFKDPALWLNFMRTQMIRAY